MKRFKPSPELTKGLNTERRFIRLIHSLQSELTFITGARKTGPIDDANAVDVTVYAKIPDRGIQKIPFQIKSSIGGAFHFEQARPEAVAAGLPLFVLHPNMSDEVAQSLIHEDIVAIYERMLLGEEFSRFYNKTQPRPRLKREYLKPGESARIKRQMLRSAKDADHRKAVNEVWRYGVTHQP